MISYAELHVSENGTAGKGTRRETRRHENENNRKEKKDRGRHGRDDMSKNEGYADDSVWNLVVEISELLERFVLWGNLHQAVHSKVWWEVFAVHLSDVHEVNKLELKRWRITKKEGRGKERRGRERYRKREREKERGRGISGRMVRRERREKERKRW